MNSRIDTKTEYAVEVPGRRYIGWMGTCDSNLDSGVNHETALNLLRETMAKYTAIGLPEAAVKLRIVSRTVTITRGDWSSVGGGANQEESA